MVKKIRFNKKHMTLSNRIEIEKGLNNNDSFRAIAKGINKAHTADYVRNLNDLTTLINHV